MSWLSTFTSWVTGGFQQSALDSLVAQIKQGFQTAESALASAVAFVISDGPTIISDAQELVAVLAALTGNLTIPAAVISALNVAIQDAQEFLAAVSAAQTALAPVSSVVSAPTQVDFVLKGHAVRAALDQAVSAARLALNSATPVQK